MCVYTKKWVCRGFGTWPPQHHTRLLSRQKQVHFISFFFFCGRHDGQMWPWLFFEALFVAVPLLWLCLANSARVRQILRESPRRPRGFIQCTSRRQHERCCASAHQSVAPDARGLRWGFAHRRLPNHDLASAAIVSCAAAGYARPFLRGGGTRYSPFECTHGRAHTLPLVGAALHAWYTIKSLGCLRGHAGDQRRHLSPV